ncbi:MAG: DinB family protein [Gemmatimonadaceae bacterium]
MSTATSTKTAIPSGLDPSVLARVTEEGYGPGAWHGADLKAALADVGPELAFWRPAPGRHNIAEIALHHAYTTRNVRSQLSGKPAEPFVLEGDDWFALSDESTLSWAKIRAALETEQRRLVKVIADIGAGRTSSSPADAERFDLVLGVTCHAVYHAGQVQLIKRLHAG